MSIFGGTLLIAIGAFICARPTTVAGTLQRFYGGYPLVRLAGERQLRSRNGLIVLMGVLFVTLGAFILVVA